RRDCTINEISSQSLPKTPKWSKDHERGSTPEDGIKLYEGFNTTISQHDAGIRTSPEVSVPTHAHRSVEGTDAAPPPLDRPAARLVFTGFLIVPYVSFFPIT